MFLTKKSKVSTMSQGYTGFTLAEVIIVLGILGIIAVNTLPVLFIEFKVKSTVTSVKRAYSLLSQSYTRAVYENQTPETWGLTTDSSGSIKILEIFSSSLRYATKCYDSNDPDAIIKGCFADEMYKKLGGLDWYNLSELEQKTVLLPDGMSLLAQVAHSNCQYPSHGPSEMLSNVCGWLTVDINGTKKPNIAGKDVFTFYLTKQGILPLGTAMATSERFNEHCSSTNAINTGFTCAAWVIYNENMDYLKCPGQLSWGGPTKCP